MERAARVHFEALRPGGMAIFETVNAHGELREHLEEVLQHAGFHILCNRTERWYRKALTATAIPFIFIMGKPRADGWADRYRGDSSLLRRQRDQEKLDSFRTEYEERLR